MEWPPGPYEYAMFALLAMTIPIQRFLTRDEVHMRVPLRGSVSYTHLTLPTTPYV